MVFLPCPSHKLVFPFQIFCSWVGKEADMPRHGIPKVQDCSNQRACRIPIWLYHVFFILIPLTEPMFAEKWERTQRRQIRVVIFQTWMDRIPKCMSRTFTYPPSKQQEKSYFLSDTMLEVDFYLIKFSSINLHSQQ